MIRLNADPCNKESAGSSSLAKGDSKLRLQTKKQIEKDQIMLESVDNYII
jgi:hypothetical protein